MAEIPRTQSFAHEHDLESNQSPPSQVRQPSSSVSLQRKLVAALKAGGSVAAPAAVVSAAAETVGSMVFRAVVPAAEPLTRTLGTSLLAGGLSVAVNAAITTTATVAGHACVDKKLYDDRGKTADEMIASKKANAGIMAALNVGGGPTAVVMNLAATAMTGGSITPLVVAKTVVSQAIGNAIAIPVLAGVAALAYKLKSSTPPPDSMQAGLEAHVNFFKNKRNEQVLPTLTTADAPRLDLAPPVPESADEQV